MRKVWILEGSLIGLFLIANIEAIKYIYRTNSTEPLEITEGKQKSAKIVTFKPRKNGSCNMTAPNLGYKEQYQPRIQNLNLNFSGANAVRALSYENITRPIESYYGLPKHLLLAVAIAETSVTEFIGTPYSSAEGLCHMTIATAQDFGLKVLSDSGANKIRKRYRNNPKALAHYDDRFHHIKNFDATGRMLNCWINNPDKRVIYRNDLTLLQKAIYRWRGLGKETTEQERKEFWNRVNHWYKYLNDPKKLVLLEKRFNAHNKHLIIDGKKADFKMYIKTMHLKNQNYDLDKYLDYLHNLRT